MSFQIPQAAIEERILALLCHNDEYATQIEETLPDDYLFSTETQHTVFKTIRPFIKQYRHAPGADLPTLFDAQINRSHDSHQQLLVQELDILSKMLWSGGEAQFVFDQLQSLLKHKRLEELCRKALEDTESGTDPDEAVLGLERGLEALNAGAAVAEQENVYDINQGLPSEELRFVDQSFSSGIDVLDDRGCRPQRGRLWLTIGLKGQGKSTRLIHFGKTAVHARKKVLHFTIEMSKEEVITKYIQAIFSLAQGNSQTVQVLRLHNGDGSECPPNTFYSLERQGINERVGYLDRVLKSDYFAHRLKIVDMPANDCTTKVIETSIRAHIKNDFTPDMVIVDYIDDMKKDSRSDAMFRESMRQIVVDLKSIAKKYNCAVCTATQANREGKSRSKLTTENTSEVFAKVHAADTVETFTRTTENANRGYALLYVENTRFGKDNITVGVSQCYEFGQFAIDSILHTTEADEASAAQEIERRQATQNQRAERNAAIAAAYRSGSTTRQIADQFGVSDDTAGNVLRSQAYFTETETEQILERLKLDANARRGRPRSN